MVRSGLRLENFFHKGHKITAAKKAFYRFFSLHSFSLFKRLFAPTSWSPMFKPSNFLEYLGKSNGKKRSQNWELLLIKGVTLPRFSANFALLARFFCFWCYYPQWSRDSLSPISGILLYNFFFFIVSDVSVWCCYLHTPRDLVSPVYGI